MGKLPDSIARDIASPAVKMGNGSLFPGVAVPRAFFGTFFRFERKYYPLRGGSPTVRAVVGASSPAGATRMRLRAHQRAFPPFPLPFSPPFCYTETAIHPPVSITD